MTQKKFDVTVIGSGAGGITAAIKASQMGAKVAIIEKNQNLGGMSFNFGFTPMQLLLLISRNLKLIKHLKTLGIDGVDSKDLKINWDKVKDIIKSEGIKASNKIRDIILENDIKLIKGKANVLNSHQIEINNDEIIETDNIIIATGGTYHYLSFMKEKATHFITPEEVFKIKELPSSLTIIGAGLVGTEFALLFSKLGTRVKLIDANTKFMPYLDEDLRKGLQKELSKNNVELFLGYNAYEFASEKLHTQDKKSNQTKSFSSDIFLLATSRVGNLSSIKNLIDKGLEVQKNFIKTDLQCRTSLKNIYAIGDVNGKYMLAHVASNEGQVAAESIMGQGKDILYDLTHYNMYSEPEFAAVGLSEELALQSGFIVKTATFPLNKFSPIPTCNDDFVKVVYDKQTDEVLGVHIMAQNANDLICEAINIMEKGDTVKDFYKLIHNHPLHSNSVVSMFQKG